LDLVYLGGDFNGAEGYAAFGLWCLWLLRLRLMRLRLGGLVGYNWCQQSTRHRRLFKLLSGLSLLQLFGLFSFGRFLNGFWLRCRFGLRWRGRLRELLRLGRWKVYHSLNGS
jgi:hypothetical protein